jgi:hypothetical protein
LVREWTVGLAPRLPSIRSLEDAHGSKWRNSVPGNAFSQFIKYSYITILF